MTKPIPCAWNGRRFPSIRAMLAAQAEWTRAASSMERRAYSMARDGYGWEDITVASREWPTGPIGGPLAKRIVWEVHHAPRR